MEWSWIAAAAVSAAVVLGLVLVWFRLRHRRPSAAGTTAVASPADALRRGLAGTRRRFLEQLEAALGRGANGLDATCSELEEALIGADVGTKATTALLARVRQRVTRTGDVDEIRRVLRDEAVAMLQSSPAPAVGARPWVVLVTGVNGVGKTTTIGKLAARHVAAGHRVLLVAADTFRAAAAEQLGVWAERAGADLVHQAAGADPSAVAFDGMKAALARGIDVVLIDTAGRLHTRTNLMDELRKVRRVIGRDVPGAPHETLLVLDATTGQNAVAQARMFREAVDVTGLVLTKLDGTARGGVVLAVRHELDLPVRFVGVGEGVDDLREFVAEDFVDALFAPDVAPAVRVA